MCVLRKSANLFQKGPYQKTLPEITQIQHTPIVHGMSRIRDSSILTRSFSVSLLIFLISLASQSAFHRLPQPPKADGLIGALLQQSVIRSSTRLISSPKTPERSHKFSVQLIQNSCRR
ncbi:uncharacterized protein A1O9_07232 [Exophiala aquamarina CBS 119918]|uniref:Uncharacterized protein n=1 Tax=Exophiala aquamarina CBS 119918 TaxID=1182545 RepID=A0A072PB91_9EURO|nr:uncharacterized protein A1O9_07232 [Exophiala aquamarina CBS 119918]KEF57042.1 hypothetical protein A1O9_07232 [Exophiala aquamarina CBS 119918]